MNNERNFMQMLKSQFAAGKHVCVGLDSFVSLDPAEDGTRQIPKFLREQYGTDIRTMIVTFNRAIIDATHDLVVAYKPNIAFYSAHGIEGLLALQDTIEYIKQVAPGVPIILDAKRGDIGNTNQGYINEAFEFLDADAVTVSPYMGMEAMRPFLDCEDKGIIVLDRTSNKGANEFQNLPIFLDNAVGINTMPLYQFVAKQVAEKWNYNGNCLLVVGATCPEELQKVREIAPNIPLLIPGIGAQGGDLEKTLAAAMVEGILRVIINSSRGIIFAYDGEDFAAVARAKTQELHDAITAYIKAAA